MNDLAGLPESRRKSIPTSRKSTKHVQRNRQSHETRDHVTGLLIDDSATKIYAPHHQRVQNHQSVLYYVNPHAAICHVYGLVIA